MSIRYDRFTLDAADGTHWDNTLRDGMTLELAPPWVIVRGLGDTTHIPLDNVSALTVWHDHATWWTDTPIPVPACADPNGVTLCTLPAGHDGCHQDINDNAWNS